MTVQDAIKLAATVLTSIGGAGLIIFSLSNWLGKVWANRLMVRESAEYERELKKLEAQYERELKKLEAQLTQKNQITLEAERAKYSLTLEELKAQLVKSNEEELSKLKSNIDIQRHTTLQEYQDKLSIYRMVGEIVAEVLANLSNVSTGQPLPEIQHDAFYRSYLKAYGYMAMLAPQPVMDSFDRLADCLLELVSGEATYDWERIRELVLDVLNQIRIDIGIDKSSIKYEGRL